MDGWLMVFGTKFDRENYSLISATMIGKGWKHFGQK